MYVYLVSSGEYSDKEIEYLAVHERQFTEEEMSAIMEETKQNYIKKGYPTEDYKVDHGHIEELFLEVLRSKSFRTVYPVGEFHLLSYSKLEDLRAEIPWIAGQEPSELRIGLG